MKHTAMRWCSATAKSIIAGEGYSVVGFKWRRKVRDKTEAIISTSSRKVVLAVRPQLLETPSPAVLMLIKRNLGLGECSVCES